LHNLTLTDSMYGDAPAEVVPEMLAPYESFMWTFNATVSNCGFVNKAMATGVDALGKKVCDRDKVIVKVKPQTCPLSKGYWKNHPEAWPIEEIEVGNVTYSKREAIRILEGASAEDATRMLLAQLIAAKLNRICGADSVFKYKDKTVDVDEVIGDSEDFLSEHPFESNPRGDARKDALQLKDWLDTYNNYKETCKNYEQKDD
jgi:hypothetical protein